MRPIPGAQREGETVEERIKARIAAARLRRETTTAVRAQMGDRRTHGLRLRYARKNETIGKTFTFDRPDDKSTLKAALMPQTIR